MLRRPPLLRLSLGLSLRAPLLLFLALGACSGSIGRSRDGGRPPDAGAPADAGGRMDAGGPIDAGPPLPCDAGFAIDPGAAAAPTEGVPFRVLYTHEIGHAFVGVEVEGPGSPIASWVGVEGSGPYTWTHEVNGHAAGVHTLRFTTNRGAITLATCQVRVLGGVPVDAGPPIDAGPGTPPPTNRYGIGLVDVGNAGLYDRAADLSGPGGHIKLIFVGVRPGMSGPTAEWADRVREVYARDLIPVVRFAPDWGDRRVRNQSDPGSDGMRYTQLAASYAAIVGGLPLRDDWPFYVEIHNEPNLCYEWACDRGVFPSDVITSERIAAEYASMVRDVADALHALGDPRIRVVNGGLAPGGVRWCRCVGTDSSAEFEAGNTSREFFAQMSAAVPGIFSRLDAFATHSYPAQGEGWGFFISYDRAAPGLRYFETELSTIGRPELPVLITETGWPTDFGGMSYANRDQVADWTRRAYQEVWLTHPNVEAVMPFILWDPGAWEAFAWLRPDNSPYPVYDAIRALRCETIPGRCP